VNRALSYPTISVLHVEARLLEIGMAEKKRSAATPTSATQDFIKPEDWAARLQVSKRQVFRWIDEGVIPPYDFAVGKTRRWHMSTFEAWVDQQTGRN
jgi:excisionase family DNA binding protein